MITLILMSRLQNEFLDGRSCMIIAGPLFLIGSLQYEYLYEQNGKYQHVAPTTLSLWWPAICASAPNHSLHLYGPMRLSVTTLFWVRMSPRISLLCMNQTEILQKCADA